MFNRLVNYWYGNSQQNSQQNSISQEERNEEIRKKRLQQLQAGTSEGSTFPAEPLSPAHTDNVPHTRETDNVSNTRETDNVSNTRETDNVPNTRETKTEPGISTEPADIKVYQPSDTKISCEDNRSAPSVPQVIGSAVVKAVDPSSQCDTNPWSEWKKGQSKQITPEGDLETRKSWLLSRIFHVTVSTAPQPPTSQPRYLTMVLDTASTTDTLSVDCLDEMLFERISMSAPELAECQVDCGGLNDHISFEPLIVRYLMYCIKRCDKERATMDVTHELYDTIQKCREAALRMIGIVLLSNDSWSPQDPAQQMVESMLPVESDYTNEAYYTNIELVQEVISQDSLTSEDLPTLIQPVLECLAKKCTMCSLTNAHVTITLLNILNVLVANKHIAKVVTKLRGWLPPDNIPAESGRGYQYTLLGSFLSCSTIRPNPSLPNTSYFSRSSAMNMATTQVSQAEYQTLIESIQTLLSKFLYQLIKSEAKQDALSWIASCLSANHNKGKLAASFMSMSSVPDGFMLNLSSVLLKLCTPFMGTINPKLCMIDVRHCAPESNSLLPLAEEDRILNKDQVTQQQLLDLAYPEQFNFITFCFYATHYALKLAYTAPFDKYRRLMKSLMETQNLIQDMRGNTMSADIRSRFESQFIEQLEMKTHLLHPEIISRVLLFYSSSAQWLSHISLVDDGVFQVPAISNALVISRNTPSIALAMIPSFFISSTCQFLINMRYFAESSLENFLSENLDCIISFLVLYCNTKWVPNPHTRAEIIESLTVFIPNNRTKSSVSTLNREAALSSNVLARERLGRALISVFVDIEHTAQFEHKFQYRYHIFEILEYIWTRSFNVHKLSEEVRGCEEDTTVLFTKFVKLLLNDANFLLDEALHNLEEIKKIQMLQADGWNELDDATRESKLKTLAELKRMCTSHNLLSSETINCIRYMTASCETVSAKDRQSVNYAFVTPLLVDTLVTMLNYYLKELVADTQTKYKVNDFAEVKFYPGKLLQGIVSIYINLQEEKAFISAIPRDGRSYYPTLFNDTVSKLRKLFVEEDIIEGIVEVSKRAEAQAVSQVDEESLSELAPAHFLDPILGTLMSEPVLLPSSNVIVDRGVIAKHLLSDPIDPFNRQPLAMVDVVPQLELQQEIKTWKLDQLAQMTASSSSDQT